MVKAEHGALILELLVGIAIFSVAIAAILKLELKALSQHTENLRTWNSEAKRFDWSVKDLSDADCNSNVTRWGEKITRCKGSTPSGNFNLVVISE